MSRFKQILLVDHALGAADRWHRYSRYSISLG